MKRNLLCWCMALLMVCGSAALALAAEVSQGKCVSYDKDAKTLTIEEYDLNFTTDYKYGHPTGINSTYSTASALVGMNPEPGDVLRIAYEVKGTDRVAIKVMNVSKQDLMKK